MKHKTINPKISQQQHKTINVPVNSNLPKLQNNPAEEDINTYMKILRKTNVEIGKSLLSERRKTKAEEKEVKKSKNVNVVKSQLLIKKSEGRNNLRKKIKEMRQARTFPLPKSYMNYKKRNGILSKNSIEIKHK